MFRKDIRITALTALSLVSFAASATANDLIAQKSTVQSIQNEGHGTVSSFQNAPRLQTGANFFDLEQKDYMRETYQDVQITLLGPLKFGVSEDVIQHRFSNIDVNYGPRVMRSNHADRFDTSTYLKATAATTSVKFKF